MKKRSSERPNPGDILEMMVEAQSRPVDDEIERTTAAENVSPSAERSVLTPIISINGKDVRWQELERRKREREEAA